MHVFDRFDIECAKGKVISAVCKHCPEIEHNAFINACMYLHPSANTC